MGRTIPFPVLSLKASGEVLLPSAVQVPIDPDTLFRTYSAYVAAIALRLLGRDEEVEDVVQDCFAKAVRHLSSLRSHDAAAIKGWLATITLHLAGRRLRARRLRGFLGLDRAPRYEDIVAPGISPEDRALLAQIYTYLDEMPTRERLAWTLRHVEGHPLDEVARLAVVPWPPPSGAFWPPTRHCRGG